MTFVLFVPGLNGHKSIAAQTDAPLPGSNYDAVRKAANMAGVPCLRATFQTTANPYPTLSQMGLMIADQIKLMQDTEGDPGLIVASSVGAGVTMQALSELDPEREVPYVIAFKPVFDPLNAINTNVKNHPSGQGATLLLSMQHGTVPKFDIPVAKSHYTDDPGNFTLTTAHLNDKDALRLVSDETQAFATLATKLNGRKINGMTIMTAQDDDVASENMLDFANAARVHVKGGITMSFVGGSHSDDQSRALGIAVTGQLRRMLQ